MSQREELSETEARRVAELISDHLVVVEGQLHLSAENQRALSQKLRGEALRPQFKGVLRQVAYTAAMLESRGGFVQPARALVGLVTELLPALERAGADRLERSPRRNRFV